MIYLIEDDHQVRKALELLFISHQYRFQSFVRGEDFLEDTSVKTLYDILVLDLNMKGVYGREFLQQLAQSNIPVSIIGITANDESLVRSYCRSYGVKALLTKPVDGNALMDLIRYHGGSMDS